MGNLNTYRKVFAYDDFPEGGTFCSMILAPDEAAADRLLAQEILVGNEWNLLDKGKPSLAAFVGSLTEIDSWTDLKGQACSNCTSCHTSMANAGQLEDLGLPISLVSRARVCISCGYVTIGAGFDRVTRGQLEVAALESIAGLDAFEALSLNGNEEPEDAPNDADCSVVVGDHQTA